MLRKSIQDLPGFSGSGVGGAPAITLRLLTIDERPTILSLVFRLIWLLALVNDSLGLRRLR